MLVQPAASGLHTWFSRGLVWGAKMDPVLGSFLGTFRITFGAHFGSPSWSPRAQKSKEFKGFGAFGLQMGVTLWVTLGPLFWYILRPGLGDILEPHNSTSILHFRNLKPKPKFNYWQKPTILRSFWQSLNLKPKAGCGAKFNFIRLRMKMDICELNILIRKFPFRQD